jgi:Ca-activated chloride channel family protein
MGINDILYVGQILMMKIRLLLMTLFIVLLGVLPVSAQQEPVCCWGVWTDPSWLKIDYQRVTVTIENQIATTNVDMQFTNEGEGLAEGTFLFPLPSEAAVDSLFMYIDGQAIEARILPATEARAIYDEIVRQFRDPALLEYVGQNAIQANVFPIPVGDSRRIEFTYSQPLSVDNGLINYVFPMNSNTLSNRSIGQMSIDVTVSGNDPISNIYSPSHNIGIFREADDDTRFTAGWEAVNFSNAEDFNLYYGLANDSISVNLLSYVESAGQDGFLMLMVQPPLSVPEERTIPKDVIIVLDQSGSMWGEAWEQAISAAEYVLKNLNPRDRFNVVMFSTGVREYSRELLGIDGVADAIDWVQNEEPTGGTNINDALITAVNMADPERATTILFLTDGLATSGIVDTPAILDNVEAVAPDNVRIFTFGVGYDVDTFLLDQLADNFKGTGAYVRPTERIDEVVSSLYNKISSPVLANVEIDFGGAQVELLYPQNVNDLFAGEQITLVGRYRRGMDDLTLTIRGQVDGDIQQFSYDGLSLRDTAGGQTFIARLWATRHIGELLNAIRLQGESQELVDSIINLSVRYGIITPYTSFLIEEDDILSQQGRERAATSFSQETESFGNVSGAGAVDAAADISALRQSSSVPSSMPSPAMEVAEAESDFDGGFGGGADGQMGQESSVNPIVTLGDKTFIQLNGVWTDTTFNPDEMETEPVVFLSDAYFDLLTNIPALGEFFALGDQVIVVYDGIAYEVVLE